MFDLFVRIALILSLALFNLFSLRVKCFADKTNRAQIYSVELYVLACMYWAEPQ